MATRSPVALIAAVVATLLVLQPQAASAAWAATGSGNAPAAATFVRRAAAPTATQVGSTVRLDWSAATLEDGTAVTGYAVLRHAGAGAPTQICTTVEPTRTCTDSAPIQGAVHYGVVATYSSWTGQESPLTPFSLDGLPPLTAVSSNPAPNGAGWNNSAVTITLTATDASAVASLTYKIGSGSPVTVIGSSTSFGVSAQGSTTITYYATDIFGNVESTKSYTVKIDTTAPTSPAFTAISNDTGTPGDRITNVAAQTLTGTAEPGSTVTISRGATTYPSVVATAGGTWSVPVTLVSGANSFTAVAVDPAGNTSATSAAFVVTLDTTSTTPTFTAISNDSGVAGDRVTNVAAQTLTGTAEPGSTVTVSRGATTYPSVVATAGGTWSVPVTLVSGANSFTAVAVDPAGNTSATSAAFVVTLDTTSTTPTFTAISNDSGVAGDRVTNVAAQTLTGTAEPGSTVTVSRGATTYPSVVATAGGTWSVPVTLVSGANSFTAVAVDPAGNTSAPSAAFVVTLDTTAPTVPTINATNSQDSGASNTDRITNVAAQTLTGTAEAGSTVTIYRGGTSLASVVVPAGGNYSVPVNLVEGVNSLTAVAVDPAGNTSQPSAALSVTLDTVAPALTITDPKNGVDYKNGPGGGVDRWNNTCGGGPGAAGACGTSSDAGSGVTSVTLVLRDTAANTCWDGGTGPGNHYAACGSPLAVTGTTTWSKAIAYNVVKGLSLQLTITATDLAGNVNTGTVTFTAQ